MQILYAVLSPLFTMHECCANLAPTAEQLPNDLLFTLSGTMRILAGDCSYDSSSCSAAVFHSSISQQLFHKASMLGLQAKTHKQWIEVAKQHTIDILIDHAHCEKKAAVYAMIMIQRYPTKTKLVLELTDIAREELEHFDIVMRILHRRGFALKHDRGNAYAKQLHERIEKQEPERLLDSLIVGSLIEARSCERFSLLAKAVEDAELRDLYAGLLASEAGHYRRYTDIAREYFPASKVKARSREFALFEADIVRNLQNSPTMHG